MFPLWILWIWELMRIINDQIFEEISLSTNPSWEARLLHVHRLPTSASQLYDHVGSKICSLSPKLRSHMLGSPRGVGSEISFARCTTWDAAMVTSRNWLDTKKKLAARMRKETHLICPLGETGGHVDSKIPLRCATKCRCPDSAGSCAIAGHVLMHPICSLHQAEPGDAVGRVLLRYGSTVWLDFFIGLNHLGGSGGRPSHLFARGKFLLSRMWRMLVEYDVQQRVRQHRDLREKVYLG